MKVHLHVCCLYSWASEFYFFKEVELEILPLVGWEIAYGIEPKESMYKNIKLSGFARLERIIYDLDRNRINVWAKDGSGSSMSNESEEIRNYFAEQMVNLGWQDSSELYNLKWI